MIGPDDRTLPRHDGRHWRRWLAAALALFVAVIVAISVLTDAEERQLEGMEPVAGRVEHVSTGHTGVRIEVTYTDADGQIRDAVVWAPERTPVPPAGSAVTVLVDPDRPGQAAIEGVDWQRRGPTVVVGILFAATVVVIGTAGVTATQRVRYRRASS